MLLLVLHGVLLAYSVIGRLAVVIAENFATRGGNNFDTHTSLVTTIFGMSAVAYILIYVIFIIGIVLATILYLAAHIFKSVSPDSVFLSECTGFQGRIPPITPDTRQS